ncbi:MAG: hypothetical protein QXW65_00135 [Candidatus Pacearchaeota archaeon]
MISANIISAEYADIYRKISEAFSEFSRDQDVDLILHCCSQLNVFFDLEKDVYEKLINFVNEKGKNKENWKEVYVCSFSFRELQEISDKYGIKIFNKSMEKIPYVTTKNNLYLIEFKEKYFPVGIIKYKKELTSKVVSFSKVFPSASIILEIHLLPIFKKVNKVSFAGKVKNKEKDLNLEVILKKEKNYIAKYTIFSEK